MGLGLGLGLGLEPWSTLACRARLLFRRACTRYTNSPRGLACGRQSPQAVWVLPFATLGQSRRGPNSTSLPSCSAIGLGLGLGLKIGFECSLGVRVVAAALLQRDLTAVDDSAVHAATVEALVSELRLVAIEQDLRMRPGDQF